MQIIDLNAFKYQRQIKRENAVKKEVALNRVRENALSDSMKYNYEFYCLIDLFMQETYPDYLWKFNVWLDRIEKGN